MSSKPKRDIKPDLVTISDDEKEPVAKKKAKSSASSPSSPSSLPSQEVLELQQKVIKLEQDFQGACRFARQYELKLEESKKRVEFLENLVDKKPTLVVNGGEKKEKNKSDETSKKLEEERKEAQKREQTLMERVKSLEKAIEIEKEKASEEKKRYQARLTDLSTHLIEATGKEEKATKKEFETAQEMNALKLEIVGLRRSLCATSDAAPGLHAQIDELWKRLAQYEGGPQLRQPQYPVRSQWVQPSLSNDAVAQNQAQLAATLAALAAVGDDEEEQAEGDAATSGERCARWIGYLA